jgi:triacylglycerol esterase/lipase EstA (alpha/beta hydrolase family)
VSPTRAALATAFPNAGPRIAVFLHGLCETEDAWELGAARHVPYGYRLEAELGYTPLYVRYNSGRHISENGRELAELLGRLLEAWPVEVSEVALIGHSMGGLVSRSACHYGASADWVTNVRHVFTLCAPHRGAPLEQATNVASAALAALPETRGFANALNLRSAGIKDLRYGYLLDEDWSGQDPDTFLRNTGREIPFLETANHYFVCATLSRESHTMSARVIGDLLVLNQSAWAHGRRGERLRFPVEHYRHVGGASHFAVLNHPAIYDQIRCWLTARKALPAPSEG